MRILIPKTPLFNIKHIIAKTSVIHLYSICNLSVIEQENKAKKSKNTISQDKHLGKKQC